MSNGGNSCRLAACAFRSADILASGLQDFWNHQDNDGNEVQLGAVKSAFQIRFIVSSPGQRDVEGRFDPDTVMRILQHLDAEEGAVNVAASLGAVQSPVTVNA